MWTIITGYIWHYLVFLLPWVLAYTALTSCGLPGFFLGRWYERLQWRREIKSGKRLGQLIREQLKDRDTRILQLTKAIQLRDEQAEDMEVQQKELVGLAHKTDEVAMRINFEALRRRRDRA